MTNWLSTGTAFDGVIANNDEIGHRRHPGAEGRQCRHGLGRSSAGVDATQDALAAMQAGDLDVTVFQDAAGQGAGALDAALALAQGEAVDQKVYIPFQLVTPANVGRLRRQELIAASFRHDEDGEAAPVPPPFSRARRDGRANRQSREGLCNDGDFGAGTARAPSAQGAPCRTERASGLIAIVADLRAAGLACSSAQSFLFNLQRLRIIILQVSIVGIIAVGVTQVIITGGIDLSSGSVVGATAMVAMSFAQVVAPVPRRSIPALTDLPVIVPMAVAVWRWGMRRASSTDR